MSPTPQYKFVTVDAEEGYFQPASKAIRSHAIKTAFQRDPSEMGANTALTSQDTLMHKSQLKGRFRLSGTSTRLTKKRGKQAAASDSRFDPVSFKPIAAASLPPWVQRLGSDSADPFNTLPIPSNPSVDSLVRYFITRFNLNSTTTDTQRPWFPYAMQSAIMMRATLSLAAEFLTAAMPLLDPKLRREGYVQKGGVMRMIGVAMLRSIEAFQGHFDAADVHLTGLYSMIEARGGPDTISHDYILCRCINWIDIQVASALGRVPKFPVFQTLDQVSLPLSVVNRAMTPSLCHLDSLGGHNSGEGNEAHKFFTTLRQAVPSQAGSVSADTIRIVMNTADSSILRFLYVERRAATPMQKRFLVLMSAAHVFLYAVLREIPTTGNMVRILVARLRAALDDADSIALMWVSHDATLLWVLFVGMVGSATTEDRQWFTRRLRKASERARNRLPLERCTRENLLQLHAGFLWRDKYCLPVLDEVWGLVGTQRHVVTAFTAVK